MLSYAIMQHLYPGTGCCPEARLLEVFVRSGTTVETFLHAERGTCTGSEKNM